MRSLCLNDFDDITASSLAEAIQSTTVPRKITYVFEGNHVMCSLCGYSVDPSAWGVLALGRAILSNPSTQIR